MGLHPRRTSVRHEGRVAAVGIAGRLAVLVTLTGASAGAQDLDVAEAPVEIHGFVSQGFIKTTENNYLGESERGSLDFTEVGLNFTKQLGDNLRVGLQLFAHDIGPLGNYEPQFDWYYLDYRFFDWLGVRAGRTKLPWGLYNEVNDVDSARVPVLLPQSIYPIANRDYLLAQTGGELYGLVPLGGAGALEYRVYGGTIFLSVSDASGNNPGAEVPYVVGSRVMWQPPLEGLSLGGSFQALRADVDFRPTAEQVAAYTQLGYIPEGWDGNAWIEATVRLWVASAEYQANDLQLAFEYARSYGEARTNLLIPPTEETTEGLYGMVSYRVRPWFTPGLYYSLGRPDLGQAKGSAAYQHDVALTLRYDLGPHWLVKLEGHYMHGTAGLSSALNGRKPLTDLEEDWAVLLVKTTAYF